MNEERKCIRQVEHIRGHLWHRYFITVNQVTVATVKLSKCWLQFNEDEPLIYQTARKRIYLLIQLMVISTDKQDNYRGCTLLLRAFLLSFHVSSAIK